MGGRAKNMKRGPYKKMQRSHLPKACLNCGEFIKNKLLFFPSTAERVKFCSKECKYVFQIGKILSEGTKTKMSKSHLGQTSWNKGIPATDGHRKAISESLKGENHWNWQGGKTAENHIRRNQLEYKQWRDAVFERDGHKCRIDNADCIHEINAHHILRFAEHKDLRFDVNNGITLCKVHHPLGREKETIMEPVYKQLIYGN